MLLHLDPFSGLSGDMFLGACLDLGLDPEVLVEAVRELGLEGVTIAVEPGLRAGISGTRFRVLVDGTDAERGGQERARHLPEIRRLIEQSALRASTRELADVLFIRLAEAEAAVHGVSLDQVHFHEVGAVDSIVDIVGAAVAMINLAPSRLTSGPVNVGSGSVATAHGRLPVPAPATAQLLAGIPVLSEGVGELLTPTGAVLLAELVDDFCALPAMRIEAVGYGLGSRDPADRPNALRIWRGAVEEERSEVACIQCEVDDVSGEALGYALERLLEAGALDAYHTPVIMKKSRPGVLVTVLARASQVADLVPTLLAETGSLGCRWHTVSRFEADREIVRVETPFGEVSMKRGSFAGRPLGAAPEFEDCRRIAAERGVPWREVYRAAIVAYGSKGGEPASEAGGETGGVGAD